MMFYNLSDQSLRTECKIRWLIPCGQFKVMVSDDLVIKYPLKVDNRVGPTELIIKCRPKVAE